MNSEDTQNNTTEPSTAVTTFPSPIRRSSTDTDSGSTKPTSASESTTENSGPDQKAGKTDTVDTESGQPGTQSTSKEAELPNPTLVESLIPQQKISEDHAAQRDALSMRTIPLASYFSINIHDSEHSENLQELSTLLPQTSVEDMLWTLKQLEMQVKPPPLGMGRLLHLLSYVRLQSKVKNLFKEMSLYEASDSIG